ncbi:AlpA family phage regulatory protein [Methylobacterium sp. WL12]|nr:AlpA family phage regulatory protein [Methylobacterium sp. WL12]
MTEPNRILRFRDVRDRTGLSRTTVWRQVKAGSFPKPVNLTKHAVGWHETDIQAWQAGLRRIGGSGGEA